ncbi:hypothetical protein OGR47_02725 [Methylocystis sp. MJC1]|uniref:hypothetical protein n=1 Tax=Methylocystis sp. MJC1 TaxID=2654282 RepID=UPI0013ED7628|nr:hypothetical protein [Methylocystis sp. MJC1]KAF2991149.1 hypothetical protein MJC1_01882 [Methylocystis sp. MJC1]MBU6525928.1 hypothetical protein [Methylocystis sp. MJC1]UZX12394.1 hypothetical protein OGR47_02725 [Methylocystis sp. MJC1]
MSNSVIILGSANGKQVVAEINPATFSAPLERVRLTMDYRREPPPGFPALDVSHRIGALLGAGMVLRVTGAEADALVAAGAAVAIDGVKPLLPAETTNKTEPAVDNVVDRAADLVTAPDATALPAKTARRGRQLPDIPPLKG